jgi:hypothetical protein
LRQLLFDYGEGPGDFVYYCCEIGGQQRFLRVDDHVCGYSRRRTGHANCFAQAALHAVALDCAAQGAAHGETDAQTLWHGRPRPRFRQHRRARPIENGEGRGKMAASLLVDALEIRVAQKARGAGKSGWFLWRHGEVGPGVLGSSFFGPSFYGGNSQRGIRHPALVQRQAAEGLGCGGERHRKSYSRKPGFTETRFRPLARRREITFLPPWVFMRVRKPCFLLRLRRLGWNVRLGMNNSCSWFRLQC